MTTMIEPQTLFLEEDAEMPNHPGFPVLIYRQVLSRDETSLAQIFEQRFEGNGWRGTWRNGIFDYHHFHPDAHEVLGVAQGSAEVQLGGETGERLRLEAGDLVILPAGTGHKKLSGSGDFLVVGAYPAGQEDYTICRTKIPREKMADVPPPVADPFYGAAGPLPTVWGFAAEAELRDED